MKNGRIALTVTMSTLAVALMIGATANQQDLTDQAAVQDAVVNFGHPVHPQPAAPANHTLHPDGVTIVKGGTVTLTMNGAGHGVAIYPVSKNTTRAHISEDLCQGVYGSASPDPTACNVENGTAALPYTITDGDGKVVIDIAEFPTQRQVDSTPGQLFSAGGLPGVLLPARPSQPGDSRRGFDLRRTAGTSSSASTGSIP